MDDDKPTLNEYAYLELWTGCIVIVIALCLLAAGALLLVGG